MKRKTKQWVKRWLAVLMCAVIIAGMVPEALMAAPGENEAENTVTIDPGNWFPAELSAGQVINVEYEAPFTADLEGVFGYFMGFYEDSYWDYEVNNASDGKNENDICTYNEFVNNHAYYAFFKVYSGYDEDDEGIGFGGTVKIGNTVLQRLTDETYYLKMTIGTPIKHKLYIDYGDRSNLLPTKLENGIEFEEGNSLRGILGDWVDNLDTMQTSDRYTVTGWSCGDESYEHLDDFDGFVHDAKADVTIKAVWSKIEKATGADFEIEVPLQGTSEGPFDDVKEQLKTDYRGPACKDVKLENPLGEDETFEAGHTYYRKYFIRAQKGYYIDDNDLPNITVNGEKITLKYDEEDEGWYFIWAFTPDDGYYDITLDYNYPDGKTEIHTITGIPAGTDLYSPDNFSIMTALRYEITKGDGITYTRYMELVAELEELLAEHEKTEDFYNITLGGYTEVDPVEGYRCDGKIGTKPSFASKAEWDEDVIDSINSDLTLYLQWQQELDSVTLTDIVAPVCGQSCAEYDAAADAGTAMLRFEDGITGSYYSFVVSDNKTRYLSKDTVFEGENDYYVKIYDVQMTLEGQESKFFNRYMTPDTKLEYKGKEYAIGVEDNGTLIYFIPVTAVHAMQDDAATTKENVVEAGCETAGSYDEVLRYECAHCHKAIEEITPKTIPALGHDWGEWKVTKEATETEEGEEERVCKRDPSHKETRVIPKKKQEEQQEEEKKEEKPATQQPVKVSENKTAQINDKNVTIDMDVTYPKAVNWTGSKITKAQLAALSQDGVIAKIKISGLEQAIEGMNKDVDTSKLLNVNYVINKEKKVNSEGSFYVKLSLNSKQLKKAKIKGKNKKALGNIVKDLNKQFKEKPYSFDIVPIELKDAESVSIKAKLKNGALQLNEDGSIKGLSKLVIKVKHPGLKKAKTYSFKAKKVAGSFKITVTDAQNKKADVTALAGKNFAGTRTGVDITK
ncbi:MAG: hypothetical protein K6B44_02505 [Lachnospiraceae bacterium]|nr:hypothetical protein [Lachnospiraceae bacterium]